MFLPFSPHRDSEWQLPRKRGEKGVVASSHAQEKGVAGGRAHTETENGLKTPLR